MALPCLIIGMNNLIQFSEADLLLDLRFDQVFKAVFTRNSRVSRKALSDLISDLIGRVIAVKTITANEPPVEFENDRRMRFDISCVAKSGELLNIEMSFNPGSFVPERFEYHEAKLFIGQNIHGKKKDYSYLKEAYQITILSKERFFPDDDLVHTFLYYDPVHGLPLKGKTRIIIMELAKARKVIEKPVKKMAGYEAWAAFLNYLTNKGKRAKINEIVKAKEGIAMASEAIIRISPSLREYLIRISEEKAFLDEKSRRIQARRAKEAAKRREETRQRKAMAEGLAEGRAEGRAEGMEKGRAEGMEKANIDNARKMKALGLSTDQIQAVTGLCAQEVEKL